MGLKILFDIEGLLRTYGYVGVFVTVFLECGLVFSLPGDSLLFTAGLLASVSHLHLYILIPLIFLGSLLGGITGYYIGVYIEHLHRYRIMRKILKPEYIAEAHKFFEQHGKAAIIISRFVPLLRTFTPIVAGIAEMPKKLFIKYSILSSLLWSTSITLLGFFLGQAFPQIKNYLSYFIVGVVIASLLPVAFEYMRRRSRKN